MDCQAQDQVRSYQTALAKAEEETKDAGAHHAACLGTERAAKKVLEAATNELEQLGIKLEVAKPNHEHLGNMASEAMQAAALQVLERNGYVKGSDGFKACLEMMESFGKISHAQSSLLATLGSEQKDPPTQAGAQEPTQGLCEKQDGPPILGADIPPFLAGPIPGLAVPPKRPTGMGRAPARTDSQSRKHTLKVNMGKTVVHRYGTESKGKEEEEEILSSGAEGGGKGSEDMSTG
jgi:hypothetical protein